MRYCPMWLSDESPRVRDDAERQVQANQCDHPQADSAESALEGGGLVWAGKNAGGP